MRNTCAAFAAFASMALAVPAPVACLAPPFRSAPPGSGSPEQLNLTFRSYPLQTADGLNLYARYIPVNNPKAVIVQFQDEGRSQNDAFQSLAWLAGRGFGLLTFDPRGTGQSGGSPDPRRLDADARMVLDFAHDFAEKNKAKLIVYGQGTGGLVALRAAPFMRSQRNLAAVALEGTYPSYSAFARQAYRERYGCVFPFNAALSVFVDDYHPEHAVGAGPGVLKKIPLFVLQGTEDRTASYDGARAVYAAASRPRFFLSLPAGHDIWRSESAREHRDLVARLFETAALGGDYSKFDEVFDPADAEY